MKGIRASIQCVLEKDPAARNALEVVLCYPGFWACLLHRPVHFLWQKNWKLLARIIGNLSRFFTNIEIHPGAVIGEGLFIDHGAGVVIGETAIVGKNVTLYQGVTLGGTGKDVGKRHPTLEDNVVVGAGAKVLGPFTIGANSKIGAGAVVLKEVPPNCTVVGNPGRIKKRSGVKVSDPGDKMAVHTHDDLCDQIIQLTKRVHEMESRLLALENTQQKGESE